MAAVTEVHITNGIPDTGTGEVPTLGATNTLVGAVTETAPANDTASSGLNGRLQRIAQNISSGVASSLPAGVNMVGFVNGTDYETVAASQTAQIAGATGAVGDYLSHVLIVPATTGAGSVSIIDGNGSNISIFVTGTLPSLVPFAVPVGAKCVNGTTPGWKITTGANVSAVAFGDFT